MHIRNHSAQVRIQSSLNGSEEKLKKGAEAIVNTLTDSNRKIRQALVISKIENADLKFENNSFDLAPYLSKQILGLAADRGFVIYQGNKD